MQKSGQSQSLENMAASRFQKTRKQTKADYVSL